MSGKKKQAPKLLQWRLECLGHAVIEGLIGLLPGPLAFRLGEALGGVVWRFLPLRRKMILRNLRIAYAGEKEIPELREMAKATFQRTVANLLSASRTASLTPEQLAKVIEIENLGLLEEALAEGKGVVLLLSHMGNWEILSRIVHFFPKGSRAGAFYRPLNNRLLDESVLARRQADGTRMFSKRDPFHEVTGFLREGGIVGILADQRVGIQGELVSFFGRLTRASPLPSLLARRAKSRVLALSVTTLRPGKWRAVFMPVEKPASTENCMLALERAMKASPLDVFWLQERWKAYVAPRRGARIWLGEDSSGGGKPLRALLWLCGVDESWRMPGEWLHPDVIYEAVLDRSGPLPSWLPENTLVHQIPSGMDRDFLQRTIESIDASAPLPVDYILAPRAPKLLVKAARRAVVPVISLP